MRSLLELWHQQNQYNQQKADLKGEQKKQGEAREQARQQAMLQRIVSLSSSYSKSLSFWVDHNTDITYVSLRLRVQNSVPAQPCVGKLGISLVLLNFLHCNFRLWFKTP